MKTYKTVTGSWLTFDSAVNEMLIQGWELYGDLKVTTWLLYFTEYHQAMTKNVS